MLKLDRESLLAAFGNRPVVLAAVEDGQITTLIEGRPNDVRNNLMGIVCGAFEAFFGEPLEETSLGLIDAFYAIMTAEIVGEEPDGEAPADNSEAPPAEQA